MSLYWLPWDALLGRLGNLVILLLLIASIIGTVVSLTAGVN